jgi:hypothetical protein
MSTDRLTQITLHASDPDDWRVKEHVRVQFNDGCFQGRFFYINGPKAHLVLETVARVCLEGWIDVNKNKIEDWPWIRPERATATC